MLCKALSVFTSLSCGASTPYFPSILWPRGNLISKAKFQIEFMFMATVQIFSFHLFTTFFQIPLSAYQISKISNKETDCQKTCYMQISISSILLYKTETVIVYSPSQPLYCFSIIKICNIFFLAFLSEISPLYIFLPFPFYRDFIALYIIDCYSIDTASLSFSISLSLSPSFLTTRTGVILKEDILTINLKACL